MEKFKFWVSGTVWGLGLLGWGYRDLGANRKRCFF